MGKIYVPESWLVTPENWTPHGVTYVFDFSQIYWCHSYMIAGAYGEKRVYKINHGNSIYKLTPSLKEGEIALFEEQFPSFPYNTQGYSLHQQPSIIRK